MSAIRPFPPRASGRDPLSSDRVGDGRTRSSLPSVSPRADSAQPEPAANWMGRPGSSSSLGFRRSSRYGRQRTIWFTSCAAMFSLDTYTTFPFRATRSGGPFAAAAAVLALANT